MEIVIVASDIHANLQAWLACDADIKRRYGPNAKIYYLGDAVGYGPNPKEILEALIALERSGRLGLKILGNHDKAATWDPEGFNGHALDAIMWTREVLEKAGARSDVYFEFLNDMKSRATIDGVEFVHGSVRGPLNDYVRPEDIYDQQKMDKLRNTLKGVSFSGHTHLPGLFDLSDAQVTFSEPGIYDPTSSMSAVLQLDKTRKQIVNVGSIGQPRDGDNRACYAVFNPATMEVAWVRVPYDFESTIRTIKTIPQLHISLGERLRHGR